MGADTNIKSKNLLLIAFFVISVFSVHEVRAAGDVVVPEYTPAPITSPSAADKSAGAKAGAAPGSVNQGGDGTQDSFGRKLIKDSFDGASDANQALSKDSVQVDCAKMTVRGGTGAPPPASAITYCNNVLNKNASTVSATGNKIAKEQSMMANVSRVSNVASVAAVGATAVAELGMKNSSQSSSLNSVSHIESTASTVSYIAGATDLAMGTYALMVQKSQLSKLQKTVNSTQKIPGGNGATIKTNLTNGKTASDLKDAIDQTNKAATSHLIYGAGKMLVGYVAGNLAKQNEKAAQNLAALTNTNAPGYITSTNGSAITGTGNNVITVVPATTATGLSTGTAASNTLSTSGASAYTPGLANDLNNALAKQNSGGGGAPPADTAAGAGGSTLGAGSKSPELGVNAVSAVSKSPYHSIGSYDNGGGPSAARGGGDSAGGGASPPDIGSMMAAMMGQDPSKQGGAATGINPNKIYEDAVSGRNPAGGESGVATNPDMDLFQMVKTKTIDMLAKGRLLGPRVVAQ